MSGKKESDTKNRSTDNGSHAQPVEVGKTHAGSHAALVLIFISISISDACLVSLEICIMVFIAVVWELRVFEL